MILKRMVVGVVGLFIVLCVSERVFKEMRRECYELEAAHRWLWRMGFFGVFIGFLCFLLCYVLFGG